MVMSLRPISFQESSTALEGLGAGLCGFSCWARPETAKEKTDKTTRERIFRMADSVQGNFVVGQRYHRKTVIGDNVLNPSWFCCTIRQTAVELTDRAKTRP